MNFITSKRVQEEGLKEVRTQYIDDQGENHIDWNITDANGVIYEATIREDGTISHQTGNYSGPDAYERYRAPSDLIARKIGPFRESNLYRCRDSGGVGWAPIVRQPEPSSRQPRPILVAAPIAPGASGHDIACTCSLVNVNLMAGCCAGGDVDEGAAGRRSRSSISSGILLRKPDAVCDSPGLVLALLVVETEPGADAGLGLGDAGIGVEIDLLVFKAPPQPLDESLSMQRPLPSLLIVIMAPSRRRVKSSLVNWLPWSISSSRPYRESASSGLDTELRAERVGEPPGQHGPAVPIHDHDQIEEAPGHRDVSDVGAPHLIDPFDRDPAEQIGVNFVGRCRLARVRPLVDRHRPASASGAGPVCG